MTKVSKKLLFCVFIFVVIHFLKDITQDILKVPTILDIFGNANEDLSRFPRAIQVIFTVFGYLSFFAEIFLIVAIPLVLGKNRHLKLEKAVWVVTVLLVLFFITATLLDPRYSFWIK